MMFYLTLVFQKTCILAIFRQVKTIIRAKNYKYLYNITFSKKYQFLKIKIKIIQGHITLIKNRIQLEIGLSSVFD